jgi:hypothetical protein
MEEISTNRKGLKGLKNVNRAMLATMMSLALGLWAPQLVSATSIAEIEPNDTGATAQNVNGSFSLDFDANINDENNLNTSTTTPHVSIRATGDGTYDFYRFTSNGGTIILDIDLTPSGNVGSDNDTEMAIWDAAGNLLLQNDDSFFDAGSLPGIGFCLGTNCNSFIQTAQVPGDYIVGVCRFACDFGNNFLITGNAISPEGFYTLHISTPQDTGTVPTPEPSTMFLLASGLAGLAAYSRRRNAHKS